LAINDGDQGESGGALVEFALTLPIMAMLILSAAELGMVAYASIQVTNASRAAAQYGAQNTSSAADTTGMQRAAANEASLVSGLTTTVSVSGICSSGNACTGNDNGSGPTCLNTDCQTNVNDHIETILTVTSSASFSPAARLNISGVGVLPSSFNLKHVTVQKCLNC